MKLTPTDAWKYSDDRMMWNASATNVLDSLNELTDSRFPWPLRDRYNMGGLPNAEQREQYGAAYELVMGPVAWQWWNLLHTDVVKASNLAPFEMEKMVCLHCLTSLVPHVTIGIGSERRSDISLLNGADPLPTLNLESRPMFRDFGITISAWGWGRERGANIDIELEFDNKYAISMARKAMMSSRRDVITRMLRTSGMWIYADEELKGNVKRHLVHNLERALDLPGVTDSLPQESLQLVKRFSAGQVDRAKITNAISHVSNLWREFILGFEEIEQHGGDLTLL
ncbi:MAG: hypothetical protein V4713_03790 [Pseudomonadota bacterium]